MPIVNVVNLERKRVLVSDVDDTICVSGKVISRRMANEIDNLIHNGYMKVFISGTGVVELVDMLSVKIINEHHILSSSGLNYTIVNGDNKKSIFQHNLTSEEKEEIKKALYELIEVFDIRTLTTESDQILDRGSQITLSSIGRHAPEHLKRSFDPDGSVRKEFVSYLNGLIGNKYDIKIGGTTSIDITKLGNDKKFGISLFAKYNNLNYDSILFFGDKLFPGGNDYPVVDLVDCIQVDSVEQTLEYFMFMNKYS
jgi:phosphomannomutase